ncbi:hypothetical protein [Nocardia gamkensis]|uniref:Uncharacterized protein n=1 Tax=Nocardia gamkensis TaxID=352869 RepID=A0A7X6R3R2_9NOCA|nr:hypothetical protein [Nocardia gamkensis]NKY27730.1 hypothetical protein [Nocardia gamkensis]NQE67367.1 hypothetical protein [Nocardia gamkensis]
MTLMPARPNGRQPEPQPTVTLRKPTDPPIATPPATGAHPSSPLGVPKRDIALSLATGKPIPRNWLPQVMALHSEQGCIGETREPDTFSQMEALVMSKGMLAAEEAREHGADQLAQLVDQAAAIKGEMATEQAELDRLDAQPVTGFNGDVIAARDARDRMTKVSATITEERDAGSLKHRRVPIWLHRFSTWAALLDFPVLLYFLSQVFNVDLTGIASGDGAAWGGSLIPLITAVVFALLGTAAVAVGLKFIGRDLKGYKDTSGGVTLPEGTARILPLVFIGLATTLAVGAGIVMAYRITSDSVSAGGGITGAAILGVYFALIVIVVNVVVFATRFRDGSLQTDEVGQLALQLEPIERQRVALQRQIDGLTAQLPPLKLKAERVYAATLAKMGAPIKGADQLRLLARSYHQGCGPEAVFVHQDGNSNGNLLRPYVGVDRSVLVELMDRLDELVAEDGKPTKGTRSTAAPKRMAPVPIAPTEADDDNLGGEW